MRELAELPAELAARIGAPRPSAERGAVLVDDDDPSAIARAVEWLRHSAPEHGTFAVACKVRDFGVSEPMCGDLMLEHWRDRLELGKSDEHVLFRVANAYRYGQNPGGILSPEAEFEPVEVVDRRQIATPLHTRNLMGHDWRPYQNYLVKGLLNFGVVGIVAGSKNAGKSPLLLDIGAHVAKGEEWNGHRVKRAHVLYLATEGWTNIGHRIEAVRREYFAGADSAAIDYAAASLDLRTSPKSARAIIATAKALAERAGLPSGLIIIDTLSHTLAGASDADQENVKPAIGYAKMIAAETGAAVLFAQHPTKNGSSMVRGAGNLEDDTDLTLWVEKETKSDRRWLSTVRTKDYGPIDPMAFDIKKVVLGKDQDGDDLVSVVVSWRPDAANEFGEKITEDERAALEDLRNTTNPTFAGWLSTYSSVRGGSARDKGMKSKFNRVRASLVNQGLVKKDEEDQYVIVD